MPRYQTAIKIVLVLFYSFLGHALDPSRKLSQFTYKNWDHRQGLPQITVKALLQDHQGYLWIGTQEGLVRFDGVEMQVIDRQNTPSLRSDYVNHLFQDQDRQIWVASRRHLFRIINGRPVIFDPASNHPKQMTWCFAQRPDGSVHVGGQGGVWVFRDGQFHREPGLGMLNELTVTHMLFDDSTLLLGTNMGLYQWDKDQEALKRITDQKVTALYREKAGASWLGTEHGLYSISKKNGGYSQGTQYFQDQIIQAMMRDDEGTLWVGTSKGLVRISDKVGSAEAPLNRKTINVLSILQDLEGNIWVGAQASGLHMFREGTVVPLGGPEGLPPYSIRSILQTREGRYWFASQVGVGVMDGRHEVSLIDESNGLPDNDSKCLYEDHSGNIWVGMNSGGLVKISKGTIVETYNTENGLLSNTIRTIRQDSKNRILACTQGGGLAIIGQGKVTNLTTKDGLKSLEIYSAIEYENQLWVGHRGDGVVVFTEKGPQTIDQKDGLIGKTIFGFYEDEDQSLWIFTESGLTRYKHGKFKTVSSKHGLGNALVYTMINDQKGGLWMSCNQAIFRVPEQEMYDFMDGKRDMITSRMFGSDDGMRSPECNFGGTGSGLLDNQGQVWFPTIAGLVYLNPTKAMEHSRSPPVLTESVLIDDTRYEGSLPSVVGPGLKRLAINYNGLYFAQPHQLHFQFRLEGFDPDWENAGNQRQAVYTNLPPKSYSFQLRSRVGDGTWKAGPRWTFEVKPYYHQRPIFWAFILLLTIVAAHSFYRYRLALHTRRENRLERLVAYRTQELQKLNSRLLRTREDLARTAHKAGMAEVASQVVHSLGNALNSANVTVALLKEDAHNLRTDLFQRLVALLDEHRHSSQFSLNEGKGQDALQALDRLSTRMVKDRQKLLEHVENLSQQIVRQTDIIRAQQGQAVAQEAFYEEVELGHLLDELLEPGITGRDIHVIRKWEILHPLKLPRARISQVFENLLDNALYSLNQANSDLAELSISAWEKGGLVHVRLSDNGVGIAAEDLQRIFFHGYTTREGHDGFGLHYCANAMKEIGGDLSAFSEGLGKGSSFTMTWPLAAN